MPRFKRVLADIKTTKNTDTDIQTTLLFPYCKHVQIAAAQQSMKINDGKF